MENIYPEFLMLSKPDEWYYSSRIKTAEKCNTYVKFLFAILIMSMNGQGEGEELVFQNLSMFGLWCIFGC